MFITKKHVSRRAILRGMGVAMASAVPGSDGRQHSSLQRKPQRIPNSGDSASRWFHSENDRDTGPPRRSARSSSSLRF